MHSNGVCTTYSVNYQDQTIELGGGYTFSKVNNHKNTNIDGRDRADRIDDDTPQIIFSCQNAVREFLNNNTFKATNGSTFSYDIGELLIKYKGEKHRFKNVEISIQNENRATITAMNSDNSKTTKFSLNSTDGTITDCSNANLVFRSRNQ